MTDHPPLFAWMTKDPTTGRWGVIGAALPGLPMTQLVMGSRHTAEAARPVAQAHRNRTGQAVRLVEFGSPTVLEDLDLGPAPTNRGGRA